MRIYIYNKPFCTLLCFHKPTPEVNSLSHNSQLKFLFASIVVGQLLLLKVLTNVNFICLDVNKCLS